MEILKTLVYDYTVSNKVGETVDVFGRRKNHIRRKRRLHRVRDRRAADGHVRRQGLLSPQAPDRQRHVLHAGRFRCVYASRHVEGGGRGLHRHDPRH